MSRPVLSSLKSERLDVDPEQIRWLNKLIKQGEGLYIEFKAKTNFPDKIVHELIAFANTDGGVLVIGINDDGVISGVKYPEEDQLQIQKALQKHCWPRLKIKSTIIKVNEKKWVVAFEVKPSNRKPIRYKFSKNKQVAYIRFQDKTLQASREAEGILRLKFGKTGLSIHYGDVENKILKTLAGHKSATFMELKILTGLSDSILSNRLITLSAANIIGWKPLDGADIFTSIN